MSTTEDGPESIEGWEMVAEVARVYEGELMAGRLRESGIDAQVVDKSFHQEPLPNARSLSIVRVYVHADNAEEARRILADPGAPSGSDSDETS